MLPKFKSLRVLSLFGYDIIKLPDSISHLKHLRFLNLSSTYVKILPDSMCTLYNLQTLLLPNCKKLEELPVNLAKLINLSYLDTSGTPLKRMPRHMSQVLTNFIVGKDTGSMIEELGKFLKLRDKLLISNLQNVSTGSDAAMANIKGKKHLEELTLKWNADTNNSQVAKDVVENLQPHSSIKYLEIDGYCGTTFPDWLGNSSFFHLGYLRLSSCKYCFCLPALGQLMALQSLEIVEMSCISAVTEEFYGDAHATKPFASLKKLIIKKMAEWEYWHIPECDVFSNLEEVCIIDCPKLIGELPKQLSSLQSLEISGCDKLVLPNTQLRIFHGNNQQLSSLRKLKIRALKNLNELYQEINRLPSLENLEIDDCGTLLPFPVSCLPASLKSLEYYKCCNLNLESESLQCGSLEVLRLVNCDSLKIISLGSFPMLKRFDIEDCNSFEILSIPSCGIGNQSSSSASLTSLQSLCIQYCDDLVSFPKGGLPAPNLTQIILRNCKKLKSLPELMESLLPSLRRLDLDGCPEIECFPEGGLPSSLQSLLIYNCKKLMSRQRERGLEKLPSLTFLRLGGTDEVESFPEEDWLLPSTLQILLLWAHENLKKLNHLGLRHLTSLQKLDIRYCIQLQSLPEEGLPASLAKVRIDGCPLVKPRLEWEKGQDWPKVAQIPCVIVDGELVP